MNMKKPVAALALAALSIGVAPAQWTFDAYLDGLQETGPNASPATGFGQVLLNPSQTMITVDLTWVNLTAPATGAHIHGPAPPGTPAGIIFPLSGVPSAASGAVPTQNFAINATQVGYLFSGLLYFNVHDNNFPAGEIRGQIYLVPEPGTLALVGLGLGALALRLRRRRA